MTILELLAQHGNNHSPNIREYEKHYGCQLPQDLSSVLSATAGFYNSPKRVYRLLDRDEILDPVKYLGVDMRSKQLLPIFDVGDNDFICYDIGTSSVTMFNIVDETTFLSRARIELTVKELEGEEIVNSLSYRIASNFTDKNDGMDGIHGALSTFIPSAGNKLPPLLIHHLEIVRDSLPFVNGNSNAQIQDATSIMTEFLAGTFAEMRKKELEGCEPSVAAKEATLTALKKLVSQYERAS